LSKLSLKGLLRIAQDCRERNETEVLEIKDGIIKPAEISDYIAQFSNNRGGLLILGLNDDGTISGKIRRFDKNNENSIQAADLETKPSVGIEIKPFQSSDKSCWIIAVKIPKPTDGIPRVSTKGAIVKRVGSRRSVIQQTGYSYENQILNNATIEDLSDYELDRFFKKLMEKKPSISSDRNHLLELFQVVRSDTHGVLRPTIAGMILFGKTSDVWVNGTRINIVRYSTSEKSSNITNSLILSGPMIINIDEVDKKVWTMIRQSPYIVSGTRYDVPEYPYLAIREATRNALFHNDYSIPGDIFIEIFPNRLEIKNMGVPLGGTRLQDLIEKPKLRNRIILKILYEMGFVEGWGIGLKTIVEQLRQNGLPEPKLTVSNEETILRFHTHAFLNSETLSWIQEITSKTPQEINHRQVLALARAKHGEKVTNQFYQEMNAVSVHVAGNELRQLCAMGLLVLQGRGKNAYYKLAEPTDASESQLEKYYPRQAINELRPVQKKILLIVLTYNRINAKQIFYQTGYSDERGVKRELSILTKMRFLNRAGKSISDPAAYYEINKSFAKGYSPHPDTPRQITFDLDL